MTGPSPGGGDLGGDAYYRRATTWALDEAASLRSALRWSRVFAAAAAVVAVFEAAALVLLAPLKTVLPVPVLVDRQTGYVQVLKGGGRVELGADAALTQSLLAQYVAAREGFDVASLPADYRKTALWSGGEARRDYLAKMPAGNPASPLRLYPRSTVVEARVKSVSSLGGAGGLAGLPGAQARTALVRFDTRRRDVDGRAAPARPWAAVVTYRFVAAPASVEDRFLNPLGFQVVRYRRDAEAPPPPDPEAPPAVPAGAVTPAPVAPVSASQPLSGARLTPSR